MAKCAIDGCETEASIEVILYDFYSSPSGATVFFEQDSTCPYICDAHAIENEKKAEGERKPRGRVRYPHTNRKLAQGFTIYRRTRA